MNERTDKRTARRQTTTNVTYSSDSTQQSTIMEEPPPPPAPPALLQLPLPAAPDVDPAEQAAAAAAAVDDHGLGAGILDGGIAGSNPDQKRTVDADLLFCLHCRDVPHVEANTNITFGMDKSSKLEVLYECFVEYVNSHFYTEKQQQHQKKCDKLQLEDIEFVHMDVLQYSEVSSMTADQCALMKGDDIVVQKNRAKERMAKERLQQVQKEIDLIFYRQMRGSLMPMSSNTTVSSSEAPSSPSSTNAVTELSGEKSNSADVVFVLEHQNHTNDNVLQQQNKIEVKAHSYILAKRCPYLWNLVEKARQSLAEENERSENLNQQGQAYKNNINGVDNVVPAQQQQVFTIEQDDTANGDFNHRSNCHENEQRDDSSINSTTAKVEDDDDDNDETRSLFYKMTSNKDDTCSNISSNSPPVFSSQKRSRSILRVLMKQQYTAEALKLLLEFCYTNRCIACGQEAFEVSCPGAVSPYYDKGWPMFGQPLISMTVALAGIVIGEESSMPKFSLMCEIAASHLINHKNVLEALSLCSTQALKSGNRLEILRNRATAYLLRTPVLDELSLDKPFMSNLNKNREQVVPALLHGTRESIGHHLKQMKFRNGNGNNVVTVGNESARNSGNGVQRVLHYHFLSQDADDRMSRALERAKWRENRQKNSKKRKFDSDDRHSDVIMCDNSMNDSKVTYL